MKPVLIINNSKKSLHLLKFIKRIKHRALLAENVFEALKVTKYVAPGLVISGEYLNDKDIRKIATQIHNNPLSSSIASIFYNAQVDKTSIAAFLNNLIKKDFKGIYIDKDLLKDISDKMQTNNSVGTFN